jgi:hypothetical protein
MTTDIFLKPKTGGVWNYFRYGSAEFGVNSFCENFTEYIFR